MTQQEYEAVTVGDLIQHEHGAPPLLVQALTFCGDIIAGSSREGAYRVTREEALARYRLISCGYHHERDPRTIVYPREES